ncbi:MAG TPA: flavin monoamine oxidase family protein [Gemmatales bacterium]|nr:flavin monoamine oxidase family protein [Gemmatales bacterium]
MSKKTDVVVVGAGMAGLRSAQLMRQKGVTVEVLEARNRVGGRIYTTQVGGTDFDLGGQWVGPQQTRLLRLASDQGVKTYPQYHMGKKLLRWQGKLRRFQGEVPWLSPLAMYELWRLERFTKKSAKQIPPDAPWNTPKAGEWDGKTLETWKQHFFRSKGAKLFLDIVSRAVCTAEPNELSLLYFLSYLRWGEGLNCLVSIPKGAQQDRFVGGVQPLCRRIADELGQQLHLESPVLSISQTGHGVVVRSKTGDYQARRVIVTIPPILAGEITYDPPLPLQRQELAKQMPMGSVIKYVAVYDRPFWRNKGFSGEAFSDTGPCVTTFDGCTSTGTPALVTFSDGAVAREYASRTPEQRKQAVLGQFAEFFGHEATQPVAFAEQNWLAETWSRGCYAGIMGPGVMTRFGPALSTPNGRIHWAGTETATQWMGYIEGALQSAERVTEEVLPLIRNPVS